ncbi:hypothetical protein PVK06_038753 [Gossypium arboreum]|uniref:Uncharacterized protein n=1 Tax=Gossypium arboreum TaxID=29729 RepID=A0ABR0N111_GOSAR|nr:hypothetical protein PVK06_038753 [Gossypium arboreum]
MQDFTSIEELTKNINLPSFCSLAESQEFLLTPVYHHEWRLSRSNLGVPVSALRPPLQFDSGEEEGISWRVFKVRVRAQVRWFGRGMAAETLASYGGWAWRDVVAACEGCGARTPLP